MTMKTIRDQVGERIAQASSRQIGQKITIISDANGGEYGPLRDNLQVVHVHSTTPLGEPRDCRYVYDHLQNNRGVYSEKIDPSTGRWRITRYLPGEWESRLDEVLEIVKNEVKEKERLREEREMKDLAKRFGID